MNNQEKLTAVALMAILGLLGWLVYRTYLFGSAQHDYEIICLDSHQYYTATFGAKLTTTIKLDDTGKPVACSKD